MGFLAIQAIIIAVVISWVNRRIRANRLITRTQQFTIMLALLILLVISWMLGVRL